MHDAASSQQAEIARIKGPEGGRILCARLNQATTEPAVHDLIIVLQRSWNIAGRESISWLQRHLFRAFTEVGVANGSY